MASTYCRFTKTKNFGLLVKEIAHCLTVDETTDIGVSKQLVVLARPAGARKTIFVGIKEMAYGAANSIIPCIQELYLEESE